MTMQLYSEPFAASGGIDARSARRAIGKPTVAFWELFLRETLQNSWDARTGEAIGFAIRGQRLSGDQMDILRNVVFQEIPSNAHALRARLNARSFRLLVVQDSGTRGLGGATRADIAPDPGASTDFVDFVRNIGRAETKRLGGGTYGFGKGVLYDASDVDTCLVYSQAVVDGRIENRFIGVSVGDELVTDGNRFTGRHWWGNLEDSGILEPVTGKDARDLAISLGLTRLKPEETGTSIAVIDPLLTRDEQLVDILQALADAAVLWAWPHMLDRSGLGPSIQFEFDVNGEAVEVTDPSSDPQFAQFTRAFEQAVVTLDSRRESHDWPWTSINIHSQRPISRLGALAFRSFSPPSGVGNLRFSHHVALLRGPLFVVKYLEVQSDSNGQALAGVFLVDPAQDKQFAKAEPVAHDDWIPAALGLQSGETNPVRVALTKIKDVFKNKVDLEQDVVGQEHAAGIAHIAREMGTLLSGVSGLGAEIEKAPREVGGGQGGRGGSGLSIRFGAESRLSISEGRVVADFPFDISTVTGLDLTGVELEVEPRVLLEGGSSEVESPLGAESPELIGWYFGGEMIGNSHRIPVSLVRSGEHFVRIRQPRDTALTVDIKIVRVT